MTQYNYDIVRRTQYLHFLWHKTNARKLFMMTNLTVTIFAGAPFVQRMLFELPYAEKNATHFFFQLILIRRRLRLMLIFLSSPFAQHVFTTSTYCFLRVHDHCTQISFRPGITYCVLQMETFFEIAVQSTPDNSNPC